jgi:CRISPR-associated protein Csb2
MILSIEVTYLMGVAVATDRQNRQQGEWPPHPDRLFSALVCACEECDLCDKAKASLRWLEQLPPPALRYSSDADYQRRDVHSSFVPINDAETSTTLPKKVKREHLAVLPSQRPRKERFFPTIVPREPKVFFLYQIDADNEAVVEQLQRVAENVTYLGHSTSPVMVEVRMEQTKGDIGATAIPVDQRSSAELQVRVPYPGRYDALLEAYERSVQLSKRFEAEDALIQPYRLSEPKRGARSSVFGASKGWVLYRRHADDRLADQFSGPLPLTQALRLSTAVRRALIECADRAGVLPCAVITGHDSNDRPTSEPHLAILPLAYTGHRYSSGQIEGFAIVLPRNIDRSAQTAVMQTLAELEKQSAKGNALIEIALSNAFRWNVRRHQPGERPLALSPSTYIGYNGGPASAHWTTITPMVFGRFPGRNSQSAKTIRAVVAACNDIGLPAPNNIEVSNSSFERAVPLASQFPRMTTRGKIVPSTHGNRSSSRRGSTQSSQEQRHASPDVPLRFQAHLRLSFDEPVAGPVVLGSGRFFGMGLCKPIYRPQPKQLQAEGGEDEL